MFFAIQVGVLDIQDSNSDLYLNYISKIVRIKDLIITTYSVYLGAIYGIVIKLVIMLFLCLIAKKLPWLIYLFKFLFKLLIYIWMIYFGQTIIIFFNCFYIWKFLTIKYLIMINLSIKFLIIKNIFVLKKKLIFVFKFFYHIF